MFRFQIRLPARLLFKRQTKVSIALRWTILIGFEIAITVLNSTDPWILVLSVYLFLWPNFFAAAFTPRRFWRYLPLATWLATLVPIIASIVVARLLCGVRRPEDYAGPIFLWYLSPYHIVLPSFLWLSIVVALAVILGRSDQRNHWVSRRSSIFVAAGAPIPIAYLGALIYVNIHGPCHA